MQDTKLPVAAQLSLFPTSSELDFWKRLNAGESLACPCCRRFSKIYTRKIHTGIALQLIQFYRLGGHEDYVHSSKLVAPGASGVGDFSKAKYWGLIEGKEKTDDAKKSSGYWKLTKKGVNYVRGNVSLPGALIFDDNIIGYTQEHETIQQALGEKFNYQELMRK